MSRLPLSGIRVLDLTRAFAGPSAAQMLGDMGAEVIKVERPGTGDEARPMGRGWLKDAQGRNTPEGSMYLAVNRNKKGITADLSSPGGQDLIRRLAQKCDVFMENYKTGDLARYGLDYAAIRALNPRIVYCSVTGFGQTGPYRHRPGYDPVFQAMGGWLSQNGESDDNPALAASNPVDTITGYPAAGGVVAGV
jgi:crotonobetainyl-CoA:carnitine CoA-transferase CaiB-like acyl-CoA transferase